MLRTTELLLSHALFGYY